MDEDMEDEQGKGSKRLEFILSAILSLPLVAAMFLVLADIDPVFCIMSIFS